MGSNCVCQTPSLRRFSAVVLVASLSCSAAGMAATELVYDIEPNDTPHEAVFLALPDNKQTIRILGELEGQDQDAYRIVVDEDRATRRIDLQLTGHAGALTRLDLFDFSDLADGRGRIPGALERRPANLMTLRAEDGGRPTRVDNLLLAPGVYVLGLSHAGEAGSYQVEIDFRDEPSLQFIDDANDENAPERLRIDRETLFWVQGEAWFHFDIDQEQAQQSFDWAMQTPAGIEARAELLDANGRVLLTQESGKGTAVTRKGLSFEPGRYRIRSRQDAAGVQAHRFEPGAALPREGREVEPNDRVPTPIEFGKTISGDLAGTDSDTLSFHIDEDQQALLFDLEVNADAESVIRVCLKRPSINLSHCRDGVDGLTRLGGLGLMAGEYTVSLHDRKRVGTDWTLTWTERGDIRAGEEVEPNDEHEHAVALHERGFGRGHFDGRETDHWRFTVTGEPRLWRAQLQGEDLFELTLQNSAGRKLMSERAGSRQRVRLDKLFLLPGEYFLAAAGTDADYILRLVDLGPPPEGMEREPNESPSNANRLQFGREHSGTLSEPNDTDRWAFSLNGHERVRLKVQPPVDGSMQGVIDAGDDARAISELRMQREPGAALEWDLFLPPGHYSLALSPGETSDAEYTIDFERGDFLERVSDREPNDDLHTAAPFPDDGRIRGRLDDSRGGEDWYRLPEVDAPIELALPRADRIRTGLFAESAPTENRFEYDRDAGLERATLRPGERHWLQVHGRGDEYDFNLSQLSDSTDPKVEPVAVTVQLEHDRIQAFSPWAQRLQGRVEVRNESDRSRTLEVEAHVTDARWQIELGTDVLALAAGASQWLSLSLHVPAETPARPAPRISVHARDRHGRGGAQVEIRADRDAPPVAPSFHWAVPEPLRGGINAAAGAFGARPVPGPLIPEDDVEDTEELYDGLARLGRWTEYKLPTERGTPTRFGQPSVELAGDDPVPVRGFLINPTASLVPQGFLRDFEVALSMDGKTFETELEGRLEPIGEEQAFVLDKPVPARFARLIPRAAQFSHTGYGAIRLGEFKVVAEPGWRPASKAFNLADPDHGGHLVWAEPWIRGSSFDRSLLRLDEKAASLRLYDSGEATVVLGFHHARAARIERFQIDPLSGARDDRKPRAVTVAVALDSPVGPWREVGATDLGDEAAALSLDEPVWARYVRFTFAAEDGASNLQLPDRIAIFEAGGDSALGEWGFYTSNGPFEAADEPEWQAVSGEPANLSRAAAEPLEPGESRPGRALLDTWSAWYRMEVPGETNLLRLEVAGRPTVEARPRLFDADGEAIELYPSEQGVARHQWEAFVEPGQSYWLEMFEPPRSVIFSWDTSASVAAYLPFIARALLDYAETIKPGRDEVNLLPFGRSSPLLKNWVGHPYPLMKMLASYPHETNSSAAEATLAVAAREMIDRPGKKGVVLLTDAATTTDASLWPALKEGQPQVFAMKLTSEGAFGGNPYVEIDLMQDWAQVRGGHFSYVSSYGVLSHGFERAVARLKAPVDFSVAVEYEQVEDPEPATIAVVTGGDGESGVDPGYRGAVGIILDASGSMLKRMAGQRRIDVAKAAVRQTIEETLPEGVPTALRVYGHREAGSCRTDLEIELSPLDKSDFLDRLESIEAINLAKTPIGASLAAVASDLKDAEGRRLVVLLTDGEETCDGDPAAEIEKLKEAGIDVRINIVGFAIDDESLKREFAEWAELGGGEYLDAGEAEALGEAMQRALQVPYVVLDASGEEVARGLVDGDPVELPPGRYTVRVEAATTRHFRDVSAAPGGAVELSLGRD